MRDEMRSRADEADNYATLLTLHEAADHLGLSAPVLRFYLHKYARSLGIPRIGSGEPLLSVRHLSRLKELYDSGLHRPRSTASGGAAEAADVEATQPRRDLEADRSVYGALPAAAARAEHARGEADSETGTPPAADDPDRHLQVHLLDMTHEWLEGMNDKIDQRLNELTQTVDFLAEENRELQVLLSRVLTAIGALAERVSKPEPAPPHRAPTMAGPAPVLQSVDKPSSKPPSDETAAGRPSGASIEREWVRTGEEIKTAARGAKTEETAEVQPLASTGSSNEQLYSPIPTIRKKEYPISVVRRQEEAKDWAPSEL